MAVNTLNFGSKVAFVNGLPLTLPILASDPGSAVAGDLYYNSTSNLPKVYNGSAWVNVNDGGSANLLTGTTLASNVVSSSLTSVGILTSGTWNATTIAINHGGTGQTTASAAFNALSPITTTGDLIYSASGATNSRLPIGSTNQVLTVVGGVPAWAAASTGANTALSNLAAVAINTSLLPGVDNSINLGSNSFSWASANIHVLADSAGVTSVDAYGRLLKDSAGTTQLTWSTSGININQLAANLNANSHKLTSLSAGTTAGDSVRYEQAILASGVNAWTANQDLGGFVITGSGTPVNPNDLVPKTYVDNFINATSWKTAVLVATTANITLSGEQTIDGFTTSASRVLVKNQSTASQNGIYVSAAGAWSRSSDMNSWANVPAAAVFVQEGTVNADIGFVCTSLPGGTLGTTAITFVQFSSAGAYSADNVTLQLVSGVFSIKNLGVGTAQLAAAAVTYAKIQNEAASTLLGNPTGSPASPSEITLGATLTFSGSALQTLALTSDVTSSANSFVTTVAKIQGTTVSGTTGSTNVVFSASPTLTGTITAAAANFSGALGANGGITSTGALTHNINGGASAFQIQASSVQRSTNGTNYVIETYTDSTTLTDNSGPTAAFSFAFASIAGEEISYVIENGASPSLTRVGTLRVTCSSDGTNPSISDMYSESADAGVSWSAATNGSNIDIKYTASNQGTNRTMRSDIKSFRR